ncbi:S-adenosyl-L-methionine-dependent tRNA 4-demethylwyosine synthase [Rhynchospora pubera]|uniref:tRNA 4-demethylwyosine synthase (AdoMet-dependent) n=1 Tax=Rhynchospora pubera TaxID=906938 RepID=A0AAV8H489_9POAL|nr:S-adenosyl-L-methionine-dependent tRNA 4-demethylwyosine synthase [Rhynchospora pubera]
MTTSLKTHIAFLSLFSLSSLYFLLKSRRLRSLRLHASPPPPPPPPPPPTTTTSPKLFYVSETNTSKTLALRLHSSLLSNSLQFSLTDPSLYEPDRLFSETLLLFVVSTWQDGKPPPSSQYFSQFLSDAANDFRVGSLVLSGCKFAIFGVGSASYGDTFNAAARDFSKWLKALGAKELVPICEGDVDAGDLDTVFNAWGDKVVRVLKGEVEGESCTNGFDEEFEEMEEMDEMEGMEPGEVDIEDIAGKAPSKNSSTELPNGGSKGENGVKEMVTPIIRSSLEKQGYKIIGSHSGVKLCRWTKSQLRGRGGCYKHSFYGIESHRCMEATPSLACANKCVFCWRHHTNPVGKSWRWKMDDPLEIVNSAIDQHKKMIKQMKGVPGVKQEQLEEGLAPRHCALSLVGEPIMYPEINSLVDELHRRHISTFLVTNAQFPDRINILNPITQLYVSVDAATKDSLKAIDRPLFGDFWERFQDSLKALRDKAQRTVYRLTLVKGWNAEDIDAYSSLLSLGEPDFVEIKGVTYCGSTTTSKLTMENVPWHTDVKSFSEALALKSNGVYEVACEHAHSCCVLLAKTNKFKIDGKWYTWIDYDRFHELVTSGKPFKSEDYMAMTPSWAVYGANEGGFDPDQARYKKERRHGAAALKN